MNLIEKTRLLFQANRALSAIEKEGRMYDVKITLFKGAKTLAMGALFAVLPVVTAYFTDPVVVGAALTSAGATPVVVSAVTVLIVAVAKMISNWLKNR